MSNSFTFPLQDKSNFSCLYLQGDNHSLPKRPPLPSKSLQIRMLKYSLLSNNLTCVITAFINITTTFMPALGVTNSHREAWQKEKEHGKPSLWAELCHEELSILSSCSTRNSSIPSLGESPLPTESTKNQLGESDLHPESTRNKQELVTWLPAVRLGVPSRTYPFVFIRAEESGVVPFLHHYEGDARLIILLQFDASLPDSQQLVVENLSHTRREVWSTGAIAIIQIPLIIYRFLLFIHR